MSFCLVEIDIYSLSFTIYSKIENKFVNVYFENNTLECDCLDRIDENKKCSHVQFIWTRVLNFEIEDVDLEMDRYDLECIINKVNNIHQSFKLKKEIIIFENTILDINHTCLICFERILTSKNIVVTSQFGHIHNSCHEIFDNFHFRK